MSIDDVKQYQEKFWEEHPDLLKKFKPVEPCLKPSNQTFKMCPVNSLLAKIADKDKEIKRLELIAKYAQHKKDCYAWDSKAKCDCGFQELFDAAEKGEG